MARALALLLLLTAAVPLVRAADPEPAVAMPAPERLQVIDPYLELHTGPGRGYPVFFVVERHGWVVIESRHTDWYKVHTAEGKVGWVDRAQLANTLTEAGERKTFRDIVFEDYLQRHVEFGGAWGHFSTAPLIKLWVAYRLSESISTELSAGQVQGQYSGTDFWNLALMVEPWSDRRLSPFFTLGVGRIYNTPNVSLVHDLTNHADMADAGVGLRYHITDRLIARLDWTEYTAFNSSSSTNQNRAVTAGLAFFF